jgi:hypothetical protein
MAAQQQHAGSARTHQVGSDTRCVGNRDGADAQQSSKHARNSRRARALLYAPCGFGNRKCEGRSWPEAVKPGQAGGGGAKERGVQREQSTTIPHRELRGAATPTGPQQSKGKVVLAPQRPPPARVDAAGRPLLWVWALRARV